MSPRKAEPPVSRFASSIADQIADLIAARGMSGAELARRISRSQNYVASRLRKELAFSVTDLGVIAATLGVTPVSVVQCAHDRMVNSDVASRWGHDVE